MSPQRAPDFYTLLAVPPSAPRAAIKLAYHRALRARHPDKRVPPAGADRAGSGSGSGSAAAAATPPDAGVGSDVDIGLLQEAYLTLSSPTQRAAYDESLLSSYSSSHGAPRPAHVVSLEDLDEDAAGGVWTHRCRCGGAHRISEADMEQGQHLVGCSSCSEVIWVGYELAADEGDGDHENNDQLRQEHGGD